MKHFLKLICLIVTFFMLTTGVLALTVSENNIEIPKSDRKSIELSTNSEEMLTSIEFTLVYTTYDIPASFIVNPNYTDSNPNGIKHKIIFSEPINGNIILGNVNINVVDNPKDNTGTVNIHSAIGYTKSGKTINLTSQNINVTANFFSKEVVKLYNMNNVNVLDEANEANEPYNINIPKQVIIYFFIGIIIALSILFIIFYFDRTIKSVEQVEQKIKLPILGGVEEYKKGGKRK